MRNLFRFGFAAAVVLVLAVGGLTYAKSQQPVAVPSEIADIDARRNELEQRIVEGRKAGKLYGMGYLSLLSEQQKLLVAQRRAEANGVTPEARQRLLEALDRASANIDRHMRN